MTLLYYHDIFLKHDTGGFHPESPRRLEAILTHLKATGLWDKLRVETPRKATEEDIALVHSQEYINAVKEMARRGGGQLDPDTVVSRDSYEASLYAAGALVDATDAVMAGEGTNTLFMGGAPRPPAPP